jgi:hypothetical protein
VRAGGPEVGARAPTKDGEPKLAVRGSQAARLLQNL